MAAGHRYVRWSEPIKQSVPLYGGRALDTAGQIRSGAGHGRRHRRERRAFNATQMGADLMHGLKEIKAMNGPSRKRLTHERVNNIREAEALAREEGLLIEPCRRSPRASRKESKT